MIALSSGIDRMNATLPVISNLRPRPERLKPLGIWQGPQGGRFRGDLAMKTGPKPKPTEARFWPKVEKGGPVISEALGPCWIWTGERDKKGYGRFCPWYLDDSQGNNVFAHRFSYELTKGKIPDGLTLDHLCRIHACVNDAHLEAVTRTVNVMRGVGPCAVHARKIACPRGHPYNKIRCDGRRRCVQCDNANRRTRWNRMRHASN